MFELGTVTHCHGYNVFSWTEEGDGSDQGLTAFALVENLCPEMVSKGSAVTNPGGLPDLNVHVFRNMLYHVSVIHACVLSTATY